MILHIVEDHSRGLIRQGEVGEVDCLLARLLARLLVDLGDLCTVVL